MIKHVSLILATFAVCIAMMHAATNDYIWSQKPASGTLVSRNLTPTVGRLVGFPASIDAPATIIIGSGLALTGSTLSATGSGGVWGTITGTLSAQTDLNTALGLKANSADLGALATLSAVTSSTITDGTIVNADISASAAIALSKLADSGTFALGATGQIAFETTALILSSAGITTEGDITANTLGGNGSAITDMNASNLSSGTIPDARFPATLPAASGANLTALNGSNISSGTVAAARMPALTGDVTTTAGSVATTIATGAVGPTQLASTAVTAGSYTNANVTVDADGRLTAASNGSGGGGGAIAKTGFATKTDTATTTSTTFTSVFSASFTPTSASNSVIITAVFPAAATNGYAVFLKITRGGTDILVGDTAGSRISHHVQYNGASGFVMTPVTLQVKDSPATTSPVTYQVEWCVESGGTAYFNRSATDASTASYGRGAASMRFDEVTP